MPFRERKYLPHMQTGEKVHLVLRQHWLMPTVKAFFWILLLVLVAAGGGFIKSTFEIPSSAETAQILDIITSAFLMLTALGLLIVWTMYYLNVQLVTNCRIIDINQKSVLHHETTELDLDNVQDVTTEIKGLVANLFNYGNVQVQTAGTEQNFVFDHIPDPHQTAKTVIILSGLTERRPKNEK